MCMCVCVCVCVCSWYTACVWVARSVRPRRNGALCSCTVLGEMQSGHGVQAGLLFHHVHCIYAALFHVRCCSVQASLRTVHQPYLAKHNHRFVSVRPDGRSPALTTSPREGHLVVRPEHVRPFRRTLHVFHGQVSPTTARACRQRKGR